MKNLKLNQMSKKEMQRVVGAGRCKDKYYCDGGWIGATIARGDAAVYELFHRQ